jgi:hypothetical protein
VGAKDLPESLVAAFAEEMEVDFAQGGQEAIGVGDDVRVGTRIGHPQSVIDQIDERQRDGEQAGFDVPQREPIFTDECDDFLRVRTERPDDGVVAVLVGSQDAVRVVVCTGHQARQVQRVGRQVDSGELVGSAHSNSPPA